MNVFSGKSSLGAEDYTHSAVKITTSGLKCHIDGPVSTSPSLVRKVSDLLKSVEIPEEMNFVVAPSASREIGEFWEMVNV